MTNPFDHRPIPVRKLRFAIGKLEHVLGKASYEALIEDFERHGIKLQEDASHYSLFEIEQLVESVFGKDTAYLLTERIKKEL